MTAGVAYPADYNPTYSGPIYTANQGRTAFSGAMGGATSTRPLGGFSGVRPGTPSTTVTATSTTWTAAAFAGYIDTAASATNGGYFFSFPSGGTGSVTAAAASPRIDIIYVQLSDVNTGDGTTVAPKVDVLYLAGTAGSGVPPATPARSFVIAQLNVPATGGGSPTVTWVPTYAVAAGGILPATSTTVAASSYPNQYLDDPTLGLLRSNGTAWVPVGGGLNQITPTSVANGSTSGSGAVSFTAASAVSLNGVFTSAFDNYLIVYDIPTRSTAAVLQFRFRLAGTDASGTSDYIYQLLASASTSTASATAATSAGLAQSLTTTQNSGKIEAFGPSIARFTRWTNEDIGYSGTGNSFQLVKGGGQHAQAAAYDGFSLLPGSGTITGTIHVYGYVK